MRRTPLISRLTALAALFFFASCASTGPSVSRVDKLRKEMEFNRKFFEASQNWLPKVYRIGYRLVTSPVPGQGDPVPKQLFVGVGAENLNEYSRDAYRIPEKLKGVIVRGLYPGSKAEGLDLLAGDVIQKIDGKKVKNLSAYQKRIKKAGKDSVRATVYRNGQVFERVLPVEKVYYGAQFFLAPTPNFEASSAFSVIEVGIGAIRYCRNDDELAVIMGHELAHTTLHHSVKKMGAGIGQSIAYGIAASAISSVSFGGVGELAMDPFRKASDAALSRRYEQEADYLGMQHAFHAGYNVESGFRIFSQLATDTLNTSTLNGLFDSHPKTTDRLLKAERIAQEFRERYPAKYQAMKQSRDWEIVIPVRPGESMDEALEHLIRQQQSQNQAASSPPPAATAPVSALQGSRP